jgi:hypothetical protein
MRRDKGRAFWSVSATSKRSAENCSALDALLCYCGGLSPVTGTRRPHLNAGKIVKRASQSRFVRKATAILLAVTVLLGGIVIDNVCATYYFYVNWMRLQKAADVATEAGLNYLPKNDSLARTTTMRYAEMNGVKPGEIVSTVVSSDKLSITIRLKRSIPFYLSAAALGLHDRAIRVTGTARLHAKPTRPGLLTPARFNLSNARPGSVPIPMGPT